MADAIHRVDWSVVISLEQLARPWFQVNDERRMRHMVVCSPASVEEGVQWAPAMSSLIRRAHELSSQSPALSGLREAQVIPLLCG